MAVLRFYESDYSYTLNKTSDTCTVVINTSAHDDFNVYNYILFCLEIMLIVS